MTRAARRVRESNPCPRRPLCAQVNHGLDRFLYRVARSAASSTMNHSQERQIMFDLLSRWLRHTPGSGKPTRRPNRKRSYRPCLEGLEDRCVPSTIMVTSTDDDINEPGTLRNAVNQNNNVDFGGDTIQFASSLAGATITL